MNRSLTFTAALIAIAALGLLAPDVQADDPKKATLQLAMSQSHQAVLAADLPAFLDSVDPLSSKANITPEQWQQLLAHSLGKKMLLRGIPDLQQDNHFLTIKTDQNWAAYYTETGLDDQNYQTLSVFLFHHANGQWRPAGKSYGLTKAKPGSEAAKTYPAWSGRQQMLDTLDSNPDFSLEQLVNKK